MLKTILLTVFIPFVSIVAGQIPAPSLHLNTYFWAFFAMLFLPEVAIVVFPKFRLWIKTLVEDGDGIPNKSDMKDMVVHYIALTFSRVSSVGLLWLYWFDHTIPEWSVILPLGAALTVEGFNVWSKKVG